MDNNRSFRSKKCVKALNYLTVRLIDRAGT